MQFPFVTLSRHLRDIHTAQRQLAVAETAIAALRDRVAAAETEAARFRGYYERLADDTLMRRGDASGPVHEAPKPTHQDQINRVARAASLVGNLTGAPISGPRHAATATT